MSTIGSRLGLKLQLAACLVLGFIFTTVALQTYPQPESVEPHARALAALEAMFSVVWFVLAYQAIQRFNTPDTKQRDQ